MPRVRPYNTYEQNSNFYGRRYGYNKTPNIGYGSNYNTYEQDAYFYDRRNYVYDKTSNLGYGGPYKTYEQDYHFYDRRNYGYHKIPNIGYGGSYNTYEQGSYFDSRRNYDNNEMLYIGYGGPYNYYEQDSYSYDRRNYGYDTPNIEHRGYVSRYRPYSRKRILLPTRDHNERNHMNLSTTVQFRNTRNITEMRDNGGSPSSSTAEDVDHNTSAKGMDDIEYLYSVNGEALVEVLDLTENQLRSSQNHNFTAPGIPATDARETKIVTDTNVTLVHGSTAEADKTNDTSSTVHCSNCDINYVCSRMNGSGLFTSRCGHLFCMSCVKKLKSYRCNLCKERISNLRKVYL